jgi:hypothetical protein
LKSINFYIVLKEPYPQIKAVIVLMNKTGGSVVAALDEVLGQVGNINAG